jgi:YVTN family beta-propeller protein
VVCGLAGWLRWCQPPREASGPTAETAKSDRVTLQDPYGVYVTNEVSGDLSLIDPATHRAIATLALGKRPRDVRVAPDRAQLYVARQWLTISPPGTDESKLPPDRTADGIGVVDVKTFRLGTILREPQDPEQTPVSRDGTRLYIANEDKDGQRPRDLER